MFNRTINDPRTEKINKLKEMSILAKDKEALIFLLNEPLGRWFIARLFDRTKLFCQSASEKANDTYYHEGERSIGRSYLRDIQQMGMQGLLLKQQLEMEYAKSIQTMDELIAESLEQEDEDE